jgi:hypothetical protein
MTAARWRSGPTVSRQAAWPEVLPSFRLGARVQSAYKGLQHEEDHRAFSSRQRSARLCGSGRSWQRLRPLSQLQKLLLHGQ